MSINPSGIPERAQNHDSLSRELRSAALAYATLGWPVFPLYPRGKRPLYRNPHPAGSDERATCRGYLHCGRFGHGVLDATTDAGIISSWWDANPHAGIGMACGQTEAGEAPDVVDIDVKGDAPGLMSRERLRRAGLLSGAIAQVRTPTGGEHIYFEPTAQGNGSIKGAGVDFRSAGGYVVMPPSPIFLPATGGQPGTVVAYTWMVLPRLGIGRTADWSAIKRMLNPPHLWPPREPGMPHETTGVDALARWMEAQTTGNRNAALHWACCKALESDADADLSVIADAGRRAGLGSAEVEKSVRSARNKVLVSLVRA